MARTSNPLSSVDQRVRDYLGDGPITSARIREAHEKVFGTKEGAAACVVRFDRAGLLRTADGGLGSRGRLAEARASGQPLPPREPRTPRERKPARSGALDLADEYARLRAMPEHKFTPRGELAAMAEDNIAKARQEEHEREREARRAARPPVDPMRKTDPRVRAAVEGIEGGKVDRARLRIIHAAVYGERPEEGPEREEWDKRFELCVPRLAKAHRLLTKERVKLSEDDKATRDSNARIMKESRGELSCLRKHAIQVAKVDADACPIGKSKSEGDALKASKKAALENLDSLWDQAMKSTSPSDAIRILGDAAELVADKFPGNKFGYEIRAANVLTEAMGDLPLAAE